jgi:hypothetical protein
VIGGTRETAVAGDRFKDLQRIQRRQAAHFRSLTAFQKIMTAGCACRPEGLIRIRIQALDSSPYIYTELSFPLALKALPG